ncbi:MAG TPA: DUF1186 domain-containing protein [Chitinophagales bacterium]|nr:DUF1186 domain-containing protein [Chitinophagales bacterium]
MTYTFRHEKSGYLIDDNSSLLSRMHGLTPELRNALEKLYDELIRRKKGTFKKIKLLAEAYPNIPQVCNLLSVAYGMKGDFERAHQINHDILAKHPDYLFGKINLAREAMNRNEYDKVLQLLGANLELKELYPDRETFHAGEVLAFENLAVEYYCYTGDIEQAKARFEIMWRLDPESAYTEDASECISAVIDEESLDNNVNDQPQIIPLFPHKASVAENDAPPFYHKEINWLYEDDLDISDDRINQLLQLPRESLIADLELALADSIRRYDFFVDKSYEDKEIGWFPVHAILLLGALKAENSLQRVLDLFRQDEEFVDFWFGDFLTERCWEWIYQIAQNKTDALLDFMLEDDVYDFSKSTIAAVMTQMALHEPSRREEVIQWFEKLFSSYLSGSRFSGKHNRFLVAVMVSALSDIDGIELKQTVHELFKAGLVDKTIVGNYAVWKENTAASKGDMWKCPLYSSIQERYASARELMHKFSDENKNEDAYNINDDDGLNNGYEDYSNYSVISSGEPYVRTERKVGRNEKCPCGSGKKYKNCCGKNG